MFLATFLTSAIPCLVLAPAAWSAPQGKALYVGPEVDSGAVSIAFLQADGSLASHAELFDPTLGDGERLGQSLVRLGDLDGDGVVDLASTLPLRDEIEILFLAPGGGVHARTHIARPQEVSGTFDGILVPLGDLNGDGLPDLGVFRSQTLWVLLLEADGSLGAWHRLGLPPGVIDLTPVGDLGGDGLFDLVALATFGEGMVISLNPDGTLAGTQTRSWPVPNLNPGLARITSLGDLDGDGTIDVHVSRGSSSEAWTLFLNGDGTVSHDLAIAAVPGIPLVGSLALLGDRDGDLLPEVALGSRENPGQENRIWILSFAVDGSFTIDSSHATPEGEPVTALADVGDLNGDGASDLAVGLPRFPNPSSGIPTLQAALDLAVDGDTIVLSSGSYPATDLVGRSLDLVAEQGHQAEIAFLRVAAVPAGDGLRLRGLRLEGLELVDNVGPVWVEDCHSFPNDSIALPAGIRVENSARAVFVRCTAKGTDFFPTLACPPSAPAGLETAAGGPGSFVTLLGCTFTGGRNAFSDAPGDFCTGLPGPGVGLLHPDDVLFASASRLIGGPSRGCGRFCTGGLRGGAGLETVGASYLLGGELVGGEPANGGNPFGCWECSPRGPGLIGKAVSLAGRPVTGRIDSPVRDPHAVAFEVHGPAGSPVWVALSDHPAAILALQGFNGSLLVPGVPIPETRLVGFTDLEGRLTGTLDLGDFPPGAEALRRVVQFFCWNRSGFTHGPLGGAHFAQIGRSVQAGEATAVVVLLAPPVGG